MEIQVPLILFIAFCAASAGIFASQAALALKGEAKEAQMPSLIASFAALVIGGVAVLFHLAQPLHIFNGFGNPTSGITQELIAIVVLVVVMLVYFVMIRRNDGDVPKWCAICAIAMAIVLDFVCAHSYMMASRPAWNSILQVLSVLGASCAIGPTAVAAIAEIKKSDAPAIGKIALVGAVIGLATTLIYVVALAMSGGALTTMGTYIGTAEGDFASVPLEPFANIAGSKNGLFVVKSRASYYVVDIKNHGYTFLGAADRCVDYGEYPARVGETDTFVTFATIKNPDTGYPASVLVRAFAL